jgi:hypothetical protein
MGDQEVKKSKSDNRLRYPKMLINMFQKNTPTSAKEKTKIPQHSMRISIGSNRNGEKVTTILSIKRRNVVRRQFLNLP